MRFRVRPKSGPARPQLVLHIGDPKTGTSSIQRALQDKSVRCDTRNILPWIKMNARNLAFDLVSEDEEKSRQKAARVRKWIDSSKADYAVISSEFMARADPEKLKIVLEHHLPEYIETARVIAYVRPHASRFLAAYIQRTKTGHYFGDFDSFHDDVNRDNPLTLHYSRRFGHWNKVFDGRFTLRPFIRSELQDGDAVSDFYSVLLGDEPFDVSDRIEENVAVTTRSLSGMRLLHQHLKNQKIDPTSRSLLGTAIANYFIPMGDIVGQKPKLDRTTAERIIATYRDDAQRLDDAFFSRPMMTEALDASIRDTVDDPLNLDVDRYFSAAEVADMESLSAAIVRSYRTCPKIWALHHRARTRKHVLGPRAVAEATANRRTIKELDAHLSDLASVLRG